MPGADTARTGAVSVLVGATVVRPENLARRKLKVQPQAADIWIGTAATVTAANGLRVASGAVFETEYQGALYALRVGAADVDTRFWEEA